MHGTGRSSGGLLRRQSRSSGGAVLLVVVAAGALYGAINGALVVGLSLNSLIVTLATGLIGRGTIYALTNGTPIGGFPRVSATSAPAIWLGLPMPVWFVLGLASFQLGHGADDLWLAHLRDRRERGGRRLSGVPVDRLKMVALSLPGSWPRSEECC